MEKELTQIAKNIRALRKAHKEGQKELAHVLNVSPGTISQWERCLRLDPDIDTLEKIAKHYRISVEYLINRDLTNFRVNEQLFEKDGIKTCFSRMYPTFSSPEALQNDFFLHAYNKMQTIFDEVMSTGTASSSSMHRCLNLFWDCWDDAKLLEAIANMLCLLLLQGSSIIEANLLKFGSAVINPDMSPQKIMTYYLRDITKPHTSQEITQTQKRKKEYAQDLSELFNYFVRLLKANSNWSDVGDYYIALGYLVNLIPSDFDDTLSKEFGEHLMSTYANLGNTYAKNFLLNISQS